MQSLSMPKILLCLCALLLVLIGTAVADEQTREVQEELRKRNLYFGDVDGKNSPELANALRRYQTRKGFPATGTVDSLTATSLNVRVEYAATETALPNVPVLRSDTAREIEESERQQLAKQAEENLDAVSTPAPAPPAEEPPPAQNLTPDRINGFVEQYLRDGESNDAGAQTRYYSYPVEYFDHGRVGPEFVTKDVANYVKRWPQRKYSLVPPVTFAAGEEEGETTVEFIIDFDVRSKKYPAKGRTRNIWRVRPEGDDLKIVAIREERLRR